MRGRSVPGARIQLDDGGEEGEQERVESVGGLEKDVYETGGKAWANSWV